MFNGYWLRPNLLPGNLTHQGGRAFYIEDLSPLNTPNHENKNETHTVHTQPRAGTLNPVIACNRG